MRLCHTLDNHPDNHPLAGQKHIKLPALTSVGILGNDYYWIDGEGFQLLKDIFPNTQILELMGKCGINIWHIIQAIQRAFVWGQVGQPFLIEDMVN